MGDPNASIPTPEPVRYRPMFGAFGQAQRTRWRPTFVSQAVARRQDAPATLAAPAPAGPQHAQIGKRDMVLNDALPAIEIDPERYTVTIDGERIGPTPAATPAAGAAILSVLIGETSRSIVSVRFRFARLTQGISPVPPAGLPIVELPMSAHDRRRVRRLIEAPDGAVLALELPTGTILHPGPAAAPGREAAPTSWPRPTRTCW